MKRYGAKKQSETLLRRRILRQLKEKLLIHPVPAAAARQERNGTILHAHNKQSHQPSLTISARSLAKLLWLGQRTQFGCSLWGELELTSSGHFRLINVIIAHHGGPSARSPPDMQWHRTLLEQLHEQRGLAPWQLACWIHLHPPGLAAPNPVDHATFAVIFGAQSLSFMLLVTPDLHFYGECATCLPPLPGAAPARLSARVAIAFEKPLQPLTSQDQAELERQYQDQVFQPCSGPAALPWPWDLPPELWPTGDPDFFGDHPYLPSAWVEAWRQEQVNLPEPDLLEYLASHRQPNGAGGLWLDPAAFDLELIAAFFDNETMSLWATLILRERLRALAGRMGWR